MRLLVTGGCGFIGSNFIRYILDHYGPAMISNVDALTYAGNPANLAGVVEAHGARYEFYHSDIANVDQMDAIFGKHQFFGKLIGAVVVRAAGDDDLLSVGVEMREREEVRGGFARGVGRGGLERRLLGEAPARAERAIDFIGRDLHEAPDPVLARGVEEHRGADDIGVNEVLRRIDRAVDPIFCPRLWFLAEPRQI